MKKNSEPVYTVYDPRCQEKPIEFVGISPRLDTLEGKRIGVVNVMGGNEEVMESVAPDIMEAVPGCTAEYYPLYDESRYEKAWNFIESCDGIIVGHNY